MFRPNKSSSGVSKNHKINYNINLDFYVMLTELYIKK